MMVRIPLNKTLLKDQVVHPIDYSFIKITGLGVKEIFLRECQAISSYMWECLA